jgi:hypothetical protein
MTRTEAEALETIINANGHIQQAAIEGNDEHGFSIEAMDENGTPITINSAKHWSNFVANGYDLEGSLV